MTLDEYLDRETARRWAWGSVDCVQFGLAWVRERTGRPLTAFFDYQSKRDAARILAANGGLEAVVTRWMSENHFVATPQPDDGDIGLVPVPVRAQIVAPVAVVIRRGPWWITREPKGIGGMQTEMIPAWRIA